MTANEGAGLLVGDAVLLKATGGAEHVCTVVRRAEGGGIRVRYKDGRGWHYLTANPSQLRFVPSSCRLLNHTLIEPILRPPAA